MGIYCKSNIENVAVVLLVPLSLFLLVLFYLPLLSLFVALVVMLLFIQLRDNKNMCRAAFQRPCSSSHGKSQCKWSSLLEKKPHLIMYKALLML